MSIKVFIVDDSAVVRKVLSDVISGVTGMEVIGSAQDPLFALPKMEKNWPDVIILDVEMPRMDGITFLKKIMIEHPTPVIMCSTLTEKGSKVSLQALSIGAIDVVAKPKANLKTSLPEASHDLIVAIRTAVKANVAVALAKTIAPIRSVAKKLSADVMLSNVSNRFGIRSGLLVAIGASTGGTQALEAILVALPYDCPPILIVQHMPEMFTKTFAERLNSLCQIEVKEAENNDPIVRGRALIAHGGKHMMLQVTQFGSSVTVKDGPLVSRHKPSVDVLFRSVAKGSGRNALGIIMTGMGDDGAKGLKEMHEVGAHTIGQNEASCVVYGMPKEAKKLGGVDQEVPLDQIPQFIVAYQQK